MWNFLYLLVCLILTLLLFFVLKSKPRINSMENKLFKASVYANIFSVLCELILQYLTIYIGIENVLTIIFSRLYLVSIAFWFTIFSKYIFYIFKPTKDEDDFEQKEKTFVKNYKICCIIHNIFLAICYILFMILPLNYYINGTEMYSYGKAVEFLRLVLGLFMFSWLIISVFNHKKIKNIKFVPILVILLLLLLNILLQKINPSLLIVSFTLTFLSYIMYFTIENPDVKMLEEMTILRDRADKANNAKSEFLSNMSHEIRTPLNAIVGFSESLKDDELPKETMEKVEDIIMASNNLLEIVNGILDISKIEANKLEIVEKEYEIEELWDELIILTKARIGDRGIDFRVNIDQTIPKVLYGDNTRLKQVVLNILTNAAKYTKEGFVDFRVSSVINKDVVKLIISVEDSGIGIKAENLPRLFSKFDRLSVEKSITIEGTGLGLAITKKLVELMGGKIVVQSIYGKGSKFTIIIDQKIISYEVQHQKETTESVTKAMNIKGAKLLIVDDNELNIKVATTLLKKYDLNIDSCTSGYDCLEKINNGQEYDIILLDDMMPKMSGKETLSKLKQIEGFKIPVIALTANAIEGMKEEYLSLGFNDYLSKPIEKKELERVLRTYLTEKVLKETNTINTDKTISIMPYQVLSALNKKEEEMELPVLKQEKNEENNGNILIVDDDELNLKVASNMINKYVNKVDTASSGSECITKIIENNNYDLILMDDMMPELDGPSTLDNLRDIEEFNTPVILLTASEYDSSIQEKIDNHKFAGYLSKPINKEELIKALTKYIK